MTRLATTVRASLAPLAVLGAVLAASGCGKSSGTVSGRITYKGTALNSGTVTFVGAKGAGSSTIDQNGNYSITKAPLGKVTITVQVPTNVTLGGPEGATMNPGAMGAPAGAGAPKQTAPPVEVPAEYARAETSKLTYEVTTGEQKHDIPID